MIRRTFVLSEAQSDITDAALWYESRGRGLGDAFMREVSVQTVNYDGSSSISSSRQGRSSRIDETLPVFSLLCR